MTARNTIFIELHNRDRPPQHRLVVSLIERLGPRGTAPEDA